MPQRVTGSYQKLGDLEYFIPFPLPPQNPPLAITGKLFDRYGQAMMRLGQLNEMANRLPDVGRFIKAYVIKEAMLSSEIEGIHTTLFEVFSQPTSGNKINKDTQLVCNYEKAVQGALSVIKEDGLPIVARVLLHAHELLLSEGEGDRANPGNWRKQAVRVGNLVPPPAPEVPRLISELEQFINANETLPPLIKAGLAHVQFETIHPFLDGNGRIGRLLIVLMLIDSGLLNVPILYPSYYFKKHHLEYYQRLDRVRTEGDYEGWLDYYLKAIEVSSFDAYRRVEDIEKLEAESRQRLNASFTFFEAANKVLDRLFQNPIITVTDLEDYLGTTYNTANNLLSRFVEEKILLPVDDRKRNKRYKFQAYLDLLEKSYNDSE